MLFNSRPICALAPELATIQSGLPVDYRAQSRSTTRTWIHLLSIGLHGPRYNRTGHNDRLFGHCAMTVSGWTMIRAERQLRQVAAKHAHKNRSDAVSFGRFTDR